MGHKGDMSGMDGKIGKREMALWLQYMRAPGRSGEQDSPAPRKLRWTELTQYQRRAVERGEHVPCWCGTDRPANGHGNGRQNRRKCRKG